MRYTMMRFPNFRRKALTLSYDDGVVNDKRLIAIMNQYGLKGTFNLNSGLFSEDGKGRLTKQQAVELYTDSGHEVAIHGKKHLSLPEVPYAVATDEVLNDRIALEEMFGTMVTGLAYAHGAYDDKTVEILKNCGVEYARTIIATESFAMPTDWLRLPTTCHHSHPKLMELARTFVEHEPRQYYWSRTPMLFYLWGHSYEFNNEDEWRIIEEFAEYMGNRDDIWYATNIEICHYVKAFESLQFSARCDKVYNPSATDVYLNYFGKKVLVEAGKRVELK